MEHEEVLRIVKGLGLNAEKYAANCQFFRAIKLLAAQTEEITKWDVAARRDKSPIHTSEEYRFLRQLEDETDKSIESVISAFSKSCSCKVNPSREIIGIEEKAT